MKKKDNEGKSLKIYRLVKEEDMNPIYQKFDNVKVDTLKYNCTRILH